MIHLRRRLVRGYFRNSQHAVGRRRVVAAVSAGFSSATGQQLARKSGSPPQETVFTSKYFELNLNELRDFLQRKDLTFSENTTHFVVKECPFCKKPTHNKPDNLNKLYISRQTGAWLCHRCSASGSWFDFKRRFDGGPSLLRMKEVSPPALPSPYLDVKNIAESQTRLLDNAKYVHVRQWLTGRGPGERGLLPNVLRKYGNWAVCRLKIRAMKNKGWQRLLPAGGSWGFFGWHTVPANAKEIVVTEGEFDAMAVYQATSLPSISLPTGCRNLPVDLLPLLERFEKIYLWMDNDQPGMEGSEKFSKKLGLRRTYIVRPLPEEKEPPKDANEALLRGIDMAAMIKNAKVLPDDRVLQFSDLRNQVMDEVFNFKTFSGIECLSLPSVTKILKGFRKGEMTVITGPTGAGKTTFLSQLSLDFACQGVNVLWGSFEVNNVRLLRKMLLQYNGAPLPIGHTADLNTIADRFQELPMSFLKFHGSTNIDEVMDAMEYCAYTLDTNVVILDNLQFMTATNPNKFQRDFDRFHLMDVAVEKFRRFATEKNIHVLLVVHPRKESDQQRLGLSSIFGTAKATQDADNVLILQKYSGEFFLDIRKNRFDGDLGSVHMNFLKHSGRLVEGRKHEESMDSDKSEEDPAPVKIAPEIKKPKNAFVKRQTFSVI